MHHNEYNQGQVCVDCSLTVETPQKRILKKERCDRFQMEKRVALQQVRRRYIQRRLKERIKANKI